MKYLSSIQKTKMIFAAVMSIILIIFSFSLEFEFGVLATIIFIPVYLIAVIVAIIKKRIYLRSELEEKQIWENYKKEHEKKEDTL